MPKTLLKVEKNTVRIRIFTTTTAGNIEAPPIIVMIFLEKRITIKISNMFKNMEELNTRFINLIFFSLLILEKTV
jgi:hypothetical protein